MKETIYNIDNLTLEDIDEKVIRTKAIMINHNNQILMGYYKKVYQFPGGHLIEGETLEECLHREIKEETGMDIDTSNLKPFYVIRYFEKNHNNRNLNRLSEVYYYDVPTDEPYHLKETHYDLEEVNGNYELRYVDLDKFDTILINSISDEDELNGIIIRDNIEVMNEYKKIFLKK